MTHTLAADDLAPPFIVHGTRTFRRTNLALFAAGFSTFALLYCVQPLMPVFSTEFGVDPAGASLSLSLSTGLLAVSLLVASALSEAWGRKPVMVASLVLSAFLTAAAAFATDWHHLLILRALTGLSLGGLPAVAMAYVGEEMHPRSVGLAMGLYIGGSGIGGMLGRVLTGVLSDAFDWRIAMATIGVLGLASGLAFWASLPASRHFRRRSLAPGALLGAFAAHLRAPALPWLFALAFLMMGGFVATYNYIGYRLTGAPYGLSQTVVGLIFLGYLAGTASSAWMGGLAGRLGRERVLPAAIVVMLAGIALTAVPWLPAIILGMAVQTFGFFGAHSVASGWVGGAAKQAKAQASSLYLFAYYLGSSVVGSIGGLAWSGLGWPGVASLVALLGAAALLIARRIGRVT